MDKPDVIAGQHTKRSRNGWAGCLNHARWRHWFAPGWMVLANIVARLGGLIILLLLGRTFDQGTLASYFSILAAIGLGVTATQSGSGPLLIRLKQATQIRPAILICGWRLIIASIAGLVIFHTHETPITLYGPLFLMLLAAALSPDWIIAARGQFRRLGEVACLGQLAGILVAGIAMITASHAALYVIVPAISVVSLALCFFWAFSARSPSLLPTGRTVSLASAVGLIGFTLLAGALPNLDFVLLAQDHPTLYLAQRVLLIFAALFAAIAGTLFARRDDGWLRDIWLLAPMAVATVLLWTLPDLVANLIYDTPSNDLVALLQTGAGWPILLALVGRYILIIQETEIARWVGWAVLVALIMTIPLIPAEHDAQTLMIWMQIRLACVMVILFCFARFADAHPNTGQENGDLHA
ncbi:hypothetical protein LPB41_20245 [Thalassospira sp. MA62]|nr:hypothetical protein [Thalassospira sp. MA62]